MNAELPAVRFLDAGGAVVRAAVPRWEPVPDAATPCPACGATRWSATLEVVACDVCGHAEELPAVVDVALERVAPVIELDPDPLPALDPPVAVDAGHRLPPEEFATARIAFYGPMAGDRAGFRHRMERPALDQPLRPGGERVRHDATTPASRGAPAKPRARCCSGSCPRAATSRPAARSPPARLWIAAMRRTLEATAARAATGERVRGGRRHAGDVHHRDGGRGDRGGGGAGAARRSRSPRPRRRSPRRCGGSRPRTSPDAHRLGFTVIETAGVVVVAPSSSTARAASVYVPAFAFFQRHAYGAVRSSATSAPLRRNSTRTTRPSVSDAVAASVDRRLPGEDRAGRGRRERDRRRGVGRRRGRRGGSRRA